MKLFITMLFTFGCGDIGSHRSVSVDSSDNQAITDNTDRPTIPIIDQQPDQSDNCLDLYLEFHALKKLKSVIEGVGGRIASRCHSLSESFIFDGVVYGKPAREVYIWD